MNPRKEWRDKHRVTDWEASEIGRLLWENDARDLALMLVRLRVAVVEKMKAQEATNSP